MFSRWFPTLHEQDSMNRRQLPDSPLPRHAHDGLALRMIRCIILHPSIEGKFKRAAATVLVIAHMSEYKAVTAFS